MRLLLFLALFTIPASAWGTDNDDPWTGPAPVDMHHPLYVNLLYPLAEKAAPVTKLQGSLSVDHTSIFLINEAEDWFVYQDKELTEGGLTLRFPLPKVGSSPLEAGFSVRARRSGPGFLDGTIRWWHDLIGAPSYIGQKEAPDNRYLDTIIYHEQGILSSGEEGATLLGDTPFWVKIGLANTRDFKSAIQLLIEAPTGDVAKGVGSGAWEGGVRLMAEGVAEGVGYTAAIGVMAPGAFRSDQFDIPLSPFVTGHLSVEYRWSSYLSLLVQSMANTTPRPGDDVYQWAYPYVDITFGFAYRAAKKGPVVFVGFSENLTMTAPDFSLHLSVRL